MNEYFVPGFGISRRVIQMKIQYYCGPGSIARPYQYQVTRDWGVRTSLG